MYENRGFVVYEYVRSDQLCGARVEPYSKIKPGESE